MEIKNSTNIMLSKFNITYKVLLYIFICLNIVLAIGISIIIPSINKVYKSPEAFEIIDKVSESFGNFLNGNIYMGDLFKTIKTAYFEFMSLMNSSKAPATLWITVIIIYILIRYATARCYPVITDIFHSFMSSNMEYGFFSNLIKNYKQGVSYSAVYTLITVPMDTIIFFAVYGITKIIYPLINVFAFTFGFIAMIILFALRITLFSGVLPIMIIEGENNFFKAFKKSKPMLKKYFNKYFSYLSLVIFVFYSAVAVLTVVTFGIAFFILMALLIVFVHIMELTYYYGYNNMCYYIDANTIVNTAPIIERIDLQDLDIHDNKNN